FDVCTTNPESEGTAGRRSRCPQSPGHQALLRGSGAPGSAGFDHPPPQEGDRLFGLAFRLEAESRSAGGTAKGGPRGNRGLSLRGAAGTHVERTNATRAAPHHPLPSLVDRRTAVSLDDGKLH